MLRAYTSAHIISSHTRHQEEAHNQQMHTPRASLITQTAPSFCKHMAALFSASSLSFSLSLLRSVSCAPRVLFHVGCMYGRCIFSVKSLVHTYICICICIYIYIYIVVYITDELWCLESNAYSAFRDDVISMFQVSLHLHGRRVAGEQAQGHGVWRILTQHKVLLSRLLHELDIALCSCQPSFFCPSCPSLR